MDLSQLKDIHLPEQISNWPPAIGWWLVLALSLFVIVAAVVFGVSYYKKNAARRQALQLLNNRFKQFQANNDQMIFLAQSNEILKRYCQQKHKEALGLSGNPWLEFLNKATAAPLFSKDSGFAISQGVYQPQCEFDATSLYKSCQQWIKSV